MPSSITIDQLSFLTGGYGAVGVGMYTLRIYKGIPLPPFSTRPLNNSQTEWKAELKRYMKIALCLGLVQLRAIERFFIGGCLYISVEKILVSFDKTNQLINAIIAGSIVGFYECGSKSSVTYQKLINSILGVAGFAALQKLILMLLEKNGILLIRPQSLISLDLDPLFYIVGSVGAYGVGFYTLYFFQDTYFPRVPQNQNEPFSAQLKQWLEFICKSFANIARIEIRVEERGFLGGCMSLALDHFFLKVGLENQFLRVAATGGMVGAYFGTYGTKGKIFGSATGVLTLGILCQLLVAPVLSREQLWEVILPFNEEGFQVQSLDANVLF